MRIQVLSDLHLEFCPNRWLWLLESFLAGDADVVAVAGDLCAWQQLAEVVPALCARAREVVYVLGNHELYGSSFDAVCRAMGELRGLPNLHWLDAGCARVGSRRFVGATLWFEEKPDNDRYAAELSDFLLIDDFRTQVYRRHRRDRRQLDRLLRPGDVVVTHHLPSRRSVHPRFAGSELNRFFVCPCEDLLAERRPALWIHGHTHESCDYRAGHTRVLCNPYGYWGHECNSAFSPALVVELPEG